MADTRCRARSRPAVLEFSFADVGEAVSCAPDFKAKVARWQNQLENSRKRLSIDDINTKLDRARLMRKVCSNKGVVLGTVLAFTEVTEAGVWALHQHFIRPFATFAAYLPDILHIGPVFVKSIPIATTGSRLVWQRPTACVHMLFNKSELK
jgi:hypothetical protein